MNSYQQTPLWSPKQESPKQALQQKSTLIPDIAWVILAGGQGKRMGGDDKGLLHHGDQRLIEHVLTKLENQGAHPIYINANRNQEQYQQLAPVFGDSAEQTETENYCGPLLGFYAALTQLTHEWYGFVPCDAPSLSKNTVSRFTQACLDSLAAHASEHQPMIDLFVADDGQYFQPVFCLINRRILPIIKAQLDEKDYKIVNLYPKVSAMRVDFSDKPEAFDNLNYKYQLSDAK